MYLIDALITTERDKRQAYTLTVGDVTLTCDLTVDGHSYKASITGDAQSYTGMVGVGVPVEPSSQEVWAGTIEGALEWLASKGKRDLLMSDKWNKGYTS